jgi:hypothetical protein
MNLNGGIAKLEQLTPPPQTPRAVVICAGDADYESQLAKQTAAGKIKPEYRAKTDRAGRC